jgi:hypothetical protein
MNVADVLAIQDLIARYGHVLDASVEDGQWERLGEIFTEDVVFDARPAGFGLMSGMSEVRGAWSAPGQVRHPRGHHSTNIVIESIVGDTARAVSKGISVFPDAGGSGRVSSVLYRDNLRRVNGTWYFARREAIRLRPLGVGQNGESNS